MIPTAKPKSDIPYDRSVYAKFPGGDEIVRYDKAGKWYRVEPARDSGLGYMHPEQYFRISLAEAINLALHAVEVGGQVYLDHAGGQMFDSKYRRELLARQREQKKLEKRPQ
jgi:hypothetical protein